MPWTNICPSHHPKTDIGTADPPKRQGSAPSLRSRPPGVGTATGTKLRLAVGALVRHGRDELRRVAGLLSAAHDGSTCGTLVLRRTHNAEGYWVHIRERKIWVDRLFSGVNLGFSRWGPRVQWFLVSLWALGWSPCGRDLHESEALNLPVSWYRDTVSERKRNSEPTTPRNDASRHSTSLPAHTPVGFFPHP